MSSKVGGTPPLIDRASVPAEDWNDLQKVAELDGDADSVSRADLELLASPGADRNRITRGRLAPATDVVVDGRKGSNKRAKQVEARNDASQRMLNTLGRHLDGRAGVTVNRSKASQRVMNIQLNATGEAGPADTMTAEQVAAFEARYATPGSDVFRPNQAAVERRAQTNPESVETRSVSADDESTINDLVSKGWFPVGQETETVEVAGEGETNTVPMSLGDLYPSGGTTPNAAKLADLEQQLAARVADGYSIDSLTLQGGTDAQPVSDALFERLAKDNLFNGAMEASGVPSPYGEALTYDEINAATTPEQRAEVLGRMKALEENPTPEMVERYGKPGPYDGNALLGNVRASRVQQYLVDSQQLSFDTSSFGTPVIRPSVPNADGSDRNPTARHIGLELSTSKEIPGDVDTVDVTNITMAKYDPTVTRERVALGFDRSGSVQNGEKAMFLLRMHEGLTSQNYDNVDFRVQFFTQRGLDGDPQTFAGTPDQAVANMAREVLGVEAPADVPEGERDAWVLDRLGTIAGRSSGNMEIDTSPGELGNTMNNNVPSVLMNLRAELGGPNEADILMFTDFDPDRMARLEGPPYSFQVYNPAIR